MIEVICKKTNIPYSITGKYYLLPQKGFFDENIYEKEDGSLYIYKNTKTQYVIANKLHNNVFKAYCTGTNLLSKEGWIVNHNFMNWKFYHEMYIEDVHDQNVSFSSDNVLLDYSEKLIVYSQHFHVNGGYLKTNELKYNCPIYYNEKSRMHLYKNEKSWLIGLTTDYSQGFYICSNSSNINTTPETADWGNNSTIIIKRYISDQNNLSQFVDHDFNANYASIGNMDISNIEWIRASYLQPQYKSIKLFNHVEPNDVLQGDVGNCWLLAAIASLAEFPNYFENYIFKTKKLSIDGKYELRLYDISKQSWITVTIDDRIPCLKRNWYDIPTPLFAKPHDNEIYILLIEKAFAKLAGSYNKLSGGYPVLGWMILTGCEDLYIWTKNEFTKTWSEKKTYLEYHKNSPWDFQNMWITNGYRSYNYDKMFTFLQAIDAKNYVMVASIRNTNELEKINKNGLVELHAYSLIHVYQYKSITLIQLRNPWGDEYEWNGDWCDTSDKWEQYPDVESEIRHKSGHDGLFWMPWYDFCTYFDSIEICAKTMEITKTEF